MNTNLLAIAAQLSDDALLAKVKVLAQRSRGDTVELIAHLGEIDARKLHRGQGAGRLFGYCTEILRFSEAAAYNRIKAARAARKYPVILDLLTDGSVNLTTVRLLAPHLTEENHRTVLAEATGMTRRQVERVVARLAPQPDVPPSIRKLPTRTPSASAAAPAGGTHGEKAPDDAASAPSALGPTPERPTNGTPLPATRRPVVSALSPDRYRVQVTVGAEAHNDLRCLQDLLRLEIPDGDPAAIVARALRLLRLNVEKAKFAATSRPRPGRGTKPGSRDIPAEVERKVWRRDGGQCAFVAKDGRRCTERSYLEFHHTEPHALGGEATVENIALRCRAHNAYEAELIFGAYDPSRICETPAAYTTRSAGNWSRDQLP